MIKEKLTKQLTEESLFVNRLSETSTAKLLSSSRNGVLETLKEAGRSNNAELIIACERIILQNDLDRYANSPMMIGSLKTGIRELDTIQRHLKLVDNAQLYKTVDESYSLPKNRQKNLPMDEARQSFKSYFARLVNLDKSRLNDEEKRIIDVRKANINAAKKLYIEKQQQVLGITQLNTRQRKQ